MHSSLALIPVRRLGVAASVLFLLSSCGGGSSVTTPPVPGPTASTAPTPGPIAAPTPIPRLSKSCAKLGIGSATARCPRETASFQNEVDAAINHLRATRPELFNGDQLLSSGQFLIGMINELDSQGICAGWDGEELAVKNSDAFNDQYDITTASGLVRSGVSAYRTTCYPAAWPLDVAPAAATPDCPNIPPSKELTCQREISKFYPDVEAAISQVIAEKPQYFDFSDHPAASDWPKVVNVDGYTKDVIAILKGKGYCARFDADGELGVKNSSNFNEQFAILLSHIWVRRGEGIYRSTCYPSAW
jgi:hypothetical protein